MQTQRAKLKRIIAFAIFLYFYLQHRVKKVEEYDRLKRQEQRAMQNTEIDEI